MSDSRYYMPGSWEGYLADEAWNDPRNFQRRAEWEAEKDWNRMERLANARAETEKFRVENEKLNSQIAKLQEEVKSLKATQDTKKEPENNSIRFNFGR